jgi:nitrile hydratase
MSYRSHADLGGQEGHGAVVPEAHVVLFHSQWERSAFGVVLAMGATGAWNIDMSRSARETLPDYAALSYYEIWTRALEKLLIERGLAGADECAAGRMLHPAKPVARVLRASEVPRVLAGGSPTVRPASQPARFAAGDPVRSRADAASHHTRLPAYARAKSGRIAHVHGPHVFADAHAQGLGEQPQWLYTVLFTGRELWGDDADQGLIVSIDAWEPYLEPMT